MGTVWMCYFPTFTTFLCRNCNLSPTHFLQPPSTSISLRTRAYQTATTRTRTRKTRRVKSDAEICNDIREFLASVGLPDDHIPSTKELLLHGWNDLANIVRRRGHKQIQEILTRSSLNVDFDSLSTETSLNERLDAAHGCEDPLAGQNENVESSVNDVKDSTDFLLGNSSSSLYIDSSSSSLDGGTNIAEVKDHAELVNEVTEENFYPTEVTIADDDCDSSRKGLYPNFGSQSSIMPTEISGELPFETVYSGNSECEDSLVGKTVADTTLSSIENHSNTSFNDSDLDDVEDKEFSHSEPLIGFPVEQKELGSLQGLDDSNDDIVENVATTSEVSIRENLSGDNRLDSVVHYAYNSSTNLDTSENLSLKEKIANFILHGELDPVEDHVSGILNGGHSQENKEYIESELPVYMPLGTHPPEDNNVLAHGNSLTSKQVVPSGALDLDQPLRDHHLPHEDLTTLDKDVDTEAPKVQNESEINHLKYMLYQKELELSRLKEQIEKEKLALSVLQTKAEEEISKARKLISDKDAELHVAEESLSGLKEVQIDFCGDGDVVEVAGSFNGWHHPIKMDPQPSSSAIDLGESRRSRFWSAILWLYPGVYEIKFVVDGKWTTDPQRESVTRGHICNNILRVER